MCALLEPQVGKPSHSASCYECKQYAWPWKALPCKRYASALLQQLKQVGK